MKPKSRYQPGDKIGGRYQVHQALMGGMGEVYLCLDLEEMYPYALKTFQQRYLTDSRRLRKTFEKEVATWVALEKHPNIVRCFMMDILDNQPFMVLEWIVGEEGKGADLRGWLRHGPLDLQLALGITIDICRGLIHAQEKQPGLVHRDLKPENILIAQGGVAKITDFGLVEIVQKAELEITGVESETDGRQSLLGQGGIVGTPLYMAPEQWRGEHLDERTDIYAVGCILYELLSGHWPFQVDFTPTTPQQLQKWLRVWQGQHENNAPPPLPDPIPVAVSELVAGCLAKTPAQRPDSLVEVLDHLEQMYQQQFTAQPRTLPPVEQFTSTDYTNRGATYDNLQRYDEALADYGRAIELDPNLTIAYYNRGNTYRDLKQYELALTDYSQAIQLNPKYASTYYNRGLTYYDLQQYQLALDDYTQAISIDPNLAPAYYNRGLTYHDLRQYQMALDDYDKAISIDPDDAIAYSNRGNTYKTLKRYELALDDYSQAISIDPNFARAYYNRGVTYEALQQSELALNNYTRAISLDPNHAKTYVNIGALLGNQGRHREALPYFEKAAQLGLPQGAQYAAQARQMLGMEPTPQIDPAQAAFEAFQQAASPAAMRQVVAQFPFMAQADFIAAIEQAIAQQVPPEQRPHFEERLGWLRQVKDEG